MKTYRLVPHPETPPDRIEAVTVQVWADAEEVLLTFQVEGEESLLIPDEQEARRQDALWKSTCFELFLQPAGSDQYFEFNFSPSSQWAAYRFAGYREGMTDLQMQVEPHVERGVPPEDFVIEADVDLSEIPAGTLKMGLSAVIEEVGGTKSYWALAHPPGDKPDFHHADCFACHLSPASEP